MGALQCNIWWNKKQPQQENETETENLRHQFLHLAHSACSCKKFGLKCLTELWELYIISTLR